MNDELITYFNSKCFETCVESFKHKLLTPTEKECMKVCLKNVRGLHVEFTNGKIKYEQDIREAQTSK
jgi:hypothetical protein